MKNSARNKIFVISAALFILLISTISYLKYDVILNKNKSDNLPTNVKVIIYAKDSCIYCIRAKELLDSRQIFYEVVDLTNNKDLHLKLVEKTGQHTVPYVFINDKFIGGYQNLQEFNMQGKL